MGLAGDLGEEPSDFSRGGIFVADPRQSLKATALATLASVAWRKELLVKLEIKKLDEPVNSMKNRNKKEWHRKT